MLIEPHLPGLAHSQAPKAVQVGVPNFRWRGLEAQGMGARQALKRILLGQCSAGGIHEAMPLGGVSEQARQDVAKQDQGHLLHVQTKDGIQQLHCPQRVLLPCLLQQLLMGR